MKSDKIEELMTLVRPTVEGQGAFLVDLSLKGEGRRQLVEVFCETERGITIDECAEISRKILPLIDGSNILGESFRLEVSSPGVGSVLKDRRQFKRNLGRLFSVKYREGEEVRFAEGELSDLTDDKICLKTGKDDLKLGIDSILEARVKIRW
ncbi:MAG TPA: hypothetical protein VIS48_12185 [Candidatus Kryptonia bacterium]